ncbi:MAG: hypothetical protein LBB98_11000, partial [Treponema sp.]|nr:hypothetical protein [Treponema sp.]
EFWSDGHFVSTVSKYGDEEIITNYVKSQGTGKDYRQLYRMNLPAAERRGIEDFSVKSLCMRGYTSPAPPVGSAPRGGVLNPKRATPFNKMCSILFMYSSLCEAVPKTEILEQPHIGRI